MKEQGIVVEGVVEEVCGNDHFKVKLKNDMVVDAHLSGKIRKHFIRILLGDRVDVEVSPYDLGKGRIMYRYK